MKPKTEIQKITPEIAKAYLATNIGHQRNVTKSHVLHLKQAMEKDQWMMTGHPIVFDFEGRLIDGQHRLLAVIESGKSVDFLVVRGVHSDAFKAMDRGKIRSNGNMFAIHGVENYVMVASATSGVLNYRRALKSNDGKGGSLNSYTRPTTAELIEEYDANQAQYQDAVLVGNKIKRLMMPSVGAIVAALALIDAKHSNVSVLSFWESFTEGANLSHGDPILTLKNRIMENAASKAKLSQNLLIMISIKAWNAYVQNKSLKLLRVTDGEGVTPIL